MKNSYVFRLVILLFIAVLFCPQKGLAVAKDQKLIFLTWAEYMPQKLVKDFEDKHNVDIEFVFFRTEDKREELLAQTMGKGFDLILSSGVSILKYMRLGWLAPIEKSKMPNLK